MSQRQHNFLEFNTVIGLMLTLVFVLFLYTPEQRTVLRGPESNVLRVLFATNLQEQNTLSPFGPGVDQDLLKTFCEQAGYTLQYISAPTHEKAWKIMDHGQADVYLGIGHVPEHLHGGPFSAGPAYAAYSPVLVRGNHGQSMKQAEPAILIPHNRTLEKNLARKDSTLARAKVTRVRQDYALATIMRSLQANTAPFALVDRERFQQLHPFFPQVRQERILHDTFPHRWFWRTDSPRLSKEMAKFWDEAKTQVYLEQLSDRYTDFIPTRDPSMEVRNISRVLQEELPKYRELILKETGKRGIDPLMFVALIYQESQFNPSARSHRGAKGLLQFTSGAAKQFNLANPMDAAQSIRAGAEYLEFLLQKLEPMKLSHWDRYFFALAAYNQGQGHLLDAIALAKKLGKKGNSWYELKTVYPLLSFRRYYEQARYGSCRGKEAVRFVNRIRYYYHMLHGFIVLSRPEAEHLGPLARAVAKPVS